MHKLALLVLSALALGSCSKDKAKNSEPTEDLGSEPSTKVDPSLPKAQVVAASTKLLESCGLRTPTRFRSGGDITPPKVLNTARAAGMRVDSSAASCSFRQSGRPMQLLASRF